MARLEDALILDCSTISGSIEEIENHGGFKQFGQKLGKSIRKLGFVYLINHGIPNKTLDSFANKSLDFFSLPSDAKLQYAKKDPINDYNGYIPAGQEKHGEIHRRNQHDLKECFDFGGFQNKEYTNYPTEIPEFQSSVDSLKFEFGTLAKKILRSLANYLDLEDESHLTKFHKKSCNILRANYYPKLSAKDNGTEEIRLGEHRDWGSLTLLIQDEVGGLEAQNSMGHWISIPPLEGSIVLNAGLAMEMLSGGQIPASNHRVRALESNFGKWRHSYAFFLYPDGGTHCFNPVVGGKENWNPNYGFAENESYSDYFRKRILGDNVVATHL